MSDTTFTRSQAEGRRQLNRFHRGFLAARIGEWLYLIALNWMVLVQFESALAVGLINACRLLPVALVSMPSGVWADRYDCRRLLTAIYGVSALLTLIVAWSFHTGQALPVLALVVFLREMVAGMEPPARNVLLSELCPNDLPRALAGNASVLNVGRVVGPLLAGYLLANSELWVVFSLGFLGLLICAAQTARLKNCNTPRVNGEKGDLKEAIIYVAQNPRLRLLIGMMIAPMLLAFPYLSLLPMIGKELLRCGPETIGTLVSLTAVGSLVSSATIVGQSARVLRGSFQVGTLLLFSLSLLVLVLSPNYTVAAIAAFIVGASSQAYRTLSRIMAQVGVPRRLQGRVVSLILMDRALIPVGTLFLGYWAEMFGVLSSGIFMSVGAGLATLTLLLWKPEIWSITTDTSDARPILPGRVLAPGPT
jgi:MFS transporter, DHA1 family, staphyloferrin A biosynthesis exporter